MAAIQLIEVEDGFARIWFRLYPFLLLYDFTVFVGFVLKDHPYCGCFFFSEKPGLSDSDKSYPLAPVPDNDRSGFRILASSFWVKPFWIRYSLMGWVVVVGV